MSCQCLYTLVFRRLSKNTTLCRYLSQVLTLKTCTWTWLKLKDINNRIPHYPIQHNKNIFLSTHSYVFVSVVLQSTAASDTLKPNIMSSAKSFLVFTLSAFLRHTQSAARYFPALKLFIWWAYTTFTRWWQHHHFCLICLKWLWNGDTEILYY